MAYCETIPRSGRWKVPLACALFTSVVLIYNKSMLTFTPWTRYRSWLDEQKAKIELNGLAKDYIGRAEIFTTKPWRIRFLNGYKSPCWKEEDGLKCLPSFYVVGFPKCGTTDLWNQLIKHPSIPALYKEPQWWTKTHFPQWPGNASFADYVSRFNNGDVNAETLIGDGSPQTLYEDWYMSTEPDASTRGYDNATLSAARNHALLPVHLIVQYTPRAKFVVMIRDPVDRLYSHYSHMYQHLTSRQRHKVARRPPSSDFHQKVVRQLRLLEECMQRPQDASQCATNTTIRKSAEESWVHIYIGLYVYHLQAAMRLVPRENVKIINFHRYRTRRTEVLHDVFKFLGLDLDLDTVKAMENSGPTVYGAKLVPTSKEDSDIVVDPMRHETRVLLTAFYRRHNVRLAEFLGDQSFEFEHT